MSRDEPPRPEPELEFIRAAREAAERTGRDLSGTLQESLRRQAEALRTPIQAVRAPAHVTSEEALATRAVRDEIERLAQITAASGDQIAALLALVDRLGASMTRSAEASHRAATWMIFLTAAIAVLTVVLVLDALGILVPA